MAPARISATIAPESPASACSHVFVTVPEIAQSVILALAIYFDDQPRPVLNRWVAHFNLLVAAALVPAAFVGLALTGPLAWDGTLSFWLKNIAIGVWIVVMGVVLGQAIYRERAAHPRDVQEHVAA